MNFGGLKILMISADRNLFVSGSAVSERIKEYGTLVEALHIVALSDSAHGLKEKKLSDNVWIYPTNSSLKLLRPLDAATIGKRIVLKHKFVRGLSVITAQDPFECGWAGLKIKKRWRLPLEVQLHTDPFSLGFSGFLNTLRKMLMKRVLKHSDSVRVVGNGLVEKVKRYTDASVASLPIYVNAAAVKEAPVEFDVHTHYPWHFIILMVCRLEKEKNIPLALKILSLVRQVHPGTGLLIVGSGREEGRLKALVRKMGLNGVVEFAGEQKSLGSYYKTANVFLQTSAFEGYGLALVEAGLSGLPVVSTPVGIAAEMESGKEAYIYPSSNPELAAEAIVDLIENNQKRENLRLDMNRKLEGMLISKEEYLRKIKSLWEETSARIK